MRKNHFNMNRIEELIKEKGYTYTSLAEKMGTTKQNLYGKLKSPSYPTLIEIANALGVDMWELFASREEILDSASLPSTVCPYCGKPLSIEIK